MQYNVGDLLINPQNRIHTIMSLSEGEHIGIIGTKWFNPFSNGWVNSVYSYRDMRKMNWKHYPVIK
jgi:hypothetical protein